MKKNNFLKLVTPTIFVLILLGLLPLVYVFFMSFHEINLNPNEENTFIGLNNYEKAVKDNYFWKSLINTSLLLIFALFFQISLGVLFAFIIYKLRIKNQFVKYFILIPLIITPVVTAFLWRLMFNPELGIINYLLSIVGISKVYWLSSGVTSMISIIIVDSWQWIPFITIIILFGLESLPKEILDSSKIDGASDTIIFKKIQIPWIIGLLNIIILFRVLDLLKLFDVIFILTGGGPGFTTETLSLYIYRNSFQLFNFGYGSALSIILMIITAIICFFIIKNLKEVSNYETN